MAFGSSVERALDLGAEGAGFDSRAERKIKKSRTGNYTVVLQWAIYLSSLKSRLPPKPNLKTNF